MKNETTTKTLRVHRNRAHITKIVETTATHTFIEFGVRLFVCLVSKTGSAIYETNKNIYRNSSICDT